MPHPQPTIISLCRQLIPDAAPISDTPHQAPTDILLAPAGAFAGRDGRTYMNNDPDAIVARFDPAAQLPVDWEHSTHLRAPSGQSAPAAGWITALEVRDGEIWGAVEWTDAGRGDVLNRAYRYYSPAYLMDNDTSIHQLASVGLTNQPNLNLPALNQRASANRRLLEQTMDERIRAVLGLQEGATPEQAVTAIETLRTSLNRAQQANTPDLNAFVPRADFDLALNRATQAEATLRETQRAELTRQVDSLIRAGLNSRRITPATESYHRAQAETDGGIERLRAYLAAAPALVNDDTLTGAPPSAAPALNASQVSIAAAFGNTSEMLKQYGGEA